MAFQFRFDRSGGHRPSRPSAIAASGRRRRRRRRQQKSEGLAEMRASCVWRSAERSHVAGVLAPKRVHLFAVPLLQPDPYVQTTVSSKLDFLTPVRRHNISLRVRAPVVGVYLSTYHQEQPSKRGDGQTNWIKFIPFVCPSQVHASPPTPPASATSSNHAYA